MGLVEFNEVGNGGGWTLGFGSIYRGLVYGGRGVLIEYH